jgi:hypothetical protein
MKSKKVGCLVIFVVVIGGIAALVYPAITGALLMANSLEFGSKGRQLHLGLFEVSMEAEALDLKPFWPLEGQYATSTEFFKIVVASNYVKGIDFTFFGGPGIKNQKDTMNPVEFTADNNAWGVVVQSTNELSNAEEYYRKDAPFLFSRNIGFGTPPGPPKEGDTIADMTGLRKDIKPFGNKVGVIVTFGGAVKILPLKVATQTNFNPKGETLKFIMP